MRQVVVTLVITGLLMLSPGAAELVRAQGATVEAPSPREVMDTLLWLLESMRGDIDRTRFDLQELSFGLAFEDAGTIVEFVRHEIAFEQYPGLLRGAEGTLISAAGNALDQAVLLAVLLTDSGHDVRIAHGRLDVDDAERLLRSMAPVTPTIAPPVAVTAAVMEQLGIDADDLAALEDRTEAALAAYAEDVDAAARFIESTIRAAGLFDVEPDGDRLVEEARDYYWVEHTLAGTEWSRAHVAFGYGADPIVEAAGHLDGDVPSELQHRFRFEVLIEQRLGNDLVVRPVMPAWERPVANMAGMAITYANLPNGFDEVEAGNDLDAILAATSFFIPLFIDGVAPGAKAFDLSGNSLSPEDASSPAAGLFQSVGGLMGGAAGTIAGESDPDDFVTLTAQWLEYTLIAPGGLESTHRRTVVDRIGTANRQAGVIAMDPTVTSSDAARALATSYTFMVAPGSYSEPYVRDHSLDAVLSSAAMLDDAYAYALDPAAPDLVLPQAYVDANKKVDHLNLYATFDMAPMDDGVVSYRAEPGLVVIERTWRGDHARVDIVNNRRRVFHVDPGSRPRPAVERAIDVGVWETRVEGLPIAHPVAGVRNTFQTMAAARAENVPIVLISPGMDAAASTMGLPAVSLAAMQEDLAAGYVVLTAGSALQSTDHVAWWRVDPRTGETLGRGGDGRGVSLASYEALTVRQSILLGGLLGAFRTGAVCASASSANLACCILENAGTAVLLVSIGVALSVLFASAAIIFFIALDVGVGTGLLVGGLLGALPTTCNNPDASRCRLGAFAS